MNILHNTKVYIECIADCHSGEPELLHQLCFSLRKNGVEAYMFYAPTQLPDPVHKYYKKYHLPFVRTIEDNLENILIVPETATNFLYMFEYIRKAIWWLNVDNWQLHVEVFVGDIRVKKLTDKVKKFSCFEKKLNIIHLVQSEYARNFLLLNKVNERQINYLSDYLNPTFIVKSKDIYYKKKKNIIAFNAKKGYDFVKKLIEAAPQLQWIPIINLSPDEIAELLASAKVYIDFGHYPCKDRNSREAAISGCCIITSKSGSAQYQDDVDIDEQYKFVDTNDNVSAIIEKIIFIFNNYEHSIKEFLYYRQKIMAEKASFEESVEKCFPIVYPRKKRIKLAILTLSERVVKLVELLKTSNKYEVTFVVDEKNANKVIKLGDGFVKIITLEDAVWLYNESGFDKFLLPSLQGRFDDYEVSANLASFNITMDEVLFAPIDAIVDESLTNEKRIGLFTSYTKAKEQAMLYNPQSS